MSKVATEAALTTLRSWAKKVQGEPLFETSVHLSSAAWLAQGEAAAEILPALDLTKPLLSCFKLLEGAAPKPAYIPRAPLRLERATFFPVDSAKAALRTDEDPLLLFQEELRLLPQRQLQQDAGLAPETIMAVRLEDLLYLFQRYGNCLPSPLEAVSLYTYARIHAAIAAILALGENELILLQGDLGEIQQFLAALRAEDAPKTLAGRSFFLQLLTEACAQYLLREAGLPLTNLLTCGGGSFTLLLPKNLAGKPIKEWLQSQQAAFRAFFLNNLHGELTLALGEAPWPQISSANDAVAQAKKQALAHLPLDLLQKFFEPQQELHFCKICGYQGKEGDFELFDEEDRSKGSYCRLCKSFEDLSEQLCKAEWLLIHHSKHQAFSEASLSQKAQRQTWLTILHALGLNVQLIGPNRVSQAPEATQWTTALALKDNSQPLPSAKIRRVQGFRPLAKPNLNLATLLAKAPDPEKWCKEDSSLPQFGILRMDLDDLGLIFRMGLPKNNLGAALALSETLKMFFEGWVGQVCNEFNQQQKDGDQAACIYSGGDDLLIVGNWALLPKLAQQIRQDFAQYTNAHPILHFSAGISLFTPQTMLSQAMKMADKALEQAKAREGKNALCWLEQVVAWDTFETVCKLQAELYNLGQERQATNFLLQTCQQLYQQYLQTAQNGKFFYGPWCWHGALQLKKTENHFQRDFSARKVVQKIQSSLLNGLENPFNEGLRFIEQLGLATQWTQLALRATRKEFASDHPESNG